MTTNNEQKRIDDSFGRKVIATLIGIVVVQGGAFIYLTGSVVNQLNTTTTLALDTKKALEAHIEKANDKLSVMMLAVGRVESTTVNTAKSADRMESTLSETNKTLNRIVPIVNQAQDYMIDHGKQHNK